MQEDKKRYFLAVSIMVGTIVGVGIFGVPIAIAEVGFVVALLYFVVLTGIQVLQGLFYAEAAIAEEGHSRFVGFVGHFLGKNASRVAALTTILGFWGAMVAYILVGGTFLQIILGPYLGGTEAVYQIVWGVVGALVVLVGLDFIAKVDLFSVIALVFVGGLIVIFSLPYVETANLVPFTDGDMFFPYGIILFSLSGLAAVPELEDILKGKHRHFRRSVVIGTLIAAVITAVFGFLVYSVSGEMTTDDSVTGLRMIVGNRITYAVAIFGFFAVATSFLTAGTNLRETFEYDYKVNKWLAWAASAGVPLVVYFLGANSFVRIIGFTGAVFYGITATLIALMYIKVVKKHLVVKKERPFIVPFWIVYLTVGLLLLGAGYEFVKTVARLF